MLFYSFFKSLVGKDVVVELKNDLSICGTLHSVDQYLNIKLTDISVTDPEKYPHMLSCLLGEKCRSTPSEVQFQCRTEQTAVLQVNSKGLETFFRDSKLEFFTKTFKNMQRFYTHCPLY
uniref:Smx5 n=1 Tax=Oryzias latipes TaxID=8090 RepID=A0A3P9LF42_ORYLA